MSEPSRWFVVLSALSFLPFLVVAVTPFLRFVIVFSAIRYALGLQQTPPNIVIISLSIFLAFFVMGDIPNALSVATVEPLLEGSIDFRAALAAGHEILSTWMLQSINPDTLAALFRISGETPPTEIESVSFQYLVPAFMLSELEFAFKAAFFVMVPFLLVDLAVASILMSLGIIMLPPITVSLPIKIMLFVLVDGWTLIGITVAESALT